MPNKVEKFWKNLINKINPKYIINFFLKPAKKLITIGSGDKYDLGDCYNLISPLPFPRFLSDKVLIGVADLVVKKFKICGIFSPGQT